MPPRWLEPQAWYLYSVLGVPRRAITVDVVRARGICWALPIAGLTRLGASSRPRLKSMMPDRWSHVRKHAVSHFTMGPGYQDGVMPRDSCPREATEQAVEIIYVVCSCTQSCAFRALARIQDQKARIKLSMLNGINTYPGAGPSVVMMGLRPSFFLFLLIAATAAAPDAALVPFPLAPAIIGTVAVAVEGALVGAAVGLRASTSAVVGDLDSVAVVGSAPNLVASFVPFIFATLRPTKL
ncbi:hypothetical protein F4808DRAFT_363538 [Astrocystis sublimbata]|nr:hypothetical protein F4808DRAFT_363538 [Astrocystis sublimbata]